MTRPSAGGLVRALVAVGLTLVVLWRSDPRAVAAAAAGADARWLGLAAALVVLDRGLMAYRCLVLLSPLSRAARPAFGAVMRVFFVSTFVGTFLPASVGGDAVRAVALARLGVPIAVSVASVVMDRVLGVLSLLLMAAGGLFLVQRLAGNPAVQVALAVTTLGCAGVAWLVFSEQADRLAGRLLGGLSSARAARAGQALVDAFQRYARHHGALANVLAGSLGVQVLRVVQAYCLGRALGITLGPATYFAFIPLILLIMLLPVTINGLGTSQAAFVWSFGQTGVPAPVAFTLSVLFVALGIVGNLPGGALYALRGLGAPPDRT